MKESSQSIETKNVVHANAPYVHLNQEVKTEKSGIDGKNIAHECNTSSVNDNVCHRQSNHTYRPPNQEITPLIKAHSADSNVNGIASHSQFEAVKHAQMGRHEEDVIDPTYNKLTSAKNAKIEV